MTFLKIEEERKKQRETGKATRFEIASFFVCAYIWAVKCQRLVDLDIVQMHMVRVLLGSKFVNGPESSSFFEKMHACC